MSAAEDEYGSAESWLIHFKEHDTNYSGICQNSETVNNLIYDYELVTNTHFVKISAVKGFFDDSTECMLPANGKVSWQPDGTPYIKLGNAYYDCQQGPDRHLKEKEKNARKFDTDHSYARKKRLLIQESIKLDCPAKITIKKIASFPGYRLEFPFLTPEDYFQNQTEYQCKKQSKILRSALSDSLVVPVIEYLVSLPLLTDHKNHFIDERALYNLRPDDLVIEKIKSLTKDGIVRVEEMQRQVIQYVHNELFHGKKPPSRCNRRFFPTNKDVRNYMYDALKEDRLKSWTYNGQLGFIEALEVIEGWEFN